jgi:arylsulfatase A-like enzyme
MDWMPTFLAAAGAQEDPASPLDGMNLLPQITQGAAPVPRKVYWRYHFNQQRAMRDGDMKYLRINGNEFLFNIVEDPLERANLKMRQPDVFERMAQAWDEWNSTMLPDRNDVSSGPLGYADELADHFGVVRKEAAGPAR